MVQTLEQAAAEGSSLLPCKLRLSPAFMTRSLQRARWTGTPHFMHGSKFVAELVGDAKLADGNAAIQLDRYVSTRKLIN